MILFFYNLALMAALILSAPWWLWKMATTHKYREGIGERLGGTARIRKLLAAGTGRPVLWLHAVSVGEVLAVSRLVSELDSALPQFRLLVSTTTRTGQDLALQRFGADRVFYCPLDLPWAVSAYLKALQPGMLILAETEFWPNLLSECFGRNIPVVVINARISDRSWPRYHRLKSIFRPILARLSAVLAQSDTDADRLRAIGCMPGRVSVAGNLKFDVRAATETDATRLLRNSASGLRIVVAGSTLDGEEATLLEAWPQLLAADARLALVLAPRHPERFSAVADLLNLSGIPWTRRSEWLSQHLVEIMPGEIILLDTIGELASVYSLASVAFVGGSIAPAGGHNPLEPAQFGVPIVMGPNYANFRAITEDLLAADALRIAQPREMAQSLIELLADRTSAEAMGASARRVFEQKAGATARCVAEIRELLQPAAEREP
jgi:3-deoxy-D-manno-octulosonic-acid transferase